MKWYIAFQIYVSRIVIISISKLFTFSTVNIFLTKILWLDVFTQKRVNKEDGEMKNQHEAEDHIFLLPAKTKPSILFCLDICYVDFLLSENLYSLIFLPFYYPHEFSEIIWLIEGVRSNITLNEIENNLDFRHFHQTHYNGTSNQYYVFVLLKCIFTKM